MRMAYEALKDRHVILVRGNHDENSMRYGQISSLELLHTILPDSILVWDEPLRVSDLYIIPHVVDQQEFDKLIAEVPKDTDVILHCNFDNPFALSEHSLNLSLQQFKGLRGKGCQIIMGHEHGCSMEQGFFRGGCWKPTTIADCLSGDKLYFDYNLDTRDIIAIKSWVASDHYLSIPYTEIANPKDLERKDFIRVTGECSLLEYSSIARLVAEVRRNSTAFVVKNDVKVKREESKIEQVDISEFNIVNLFLQALDDDIREEVRSCILAK
jgi:hypothetical protein